MSIFSYGRLGFDVPANITVTVGHPVLVGGTSWMLFLRCVVFGLEQSAASCLQRGRVSESFWSSVGEEATSSLARFEVLEARGSYREGRLHNVTFSTEQMMGYSLFLSLAITTAHQMVMEEVRMDSTMVV